MSDKKVEISISFLNENMDIAAKSLTMLNSNFNLMAQGMKILNANNTDKTISTLSDATNKANASTETFQNTLKSIMAIELERNSGLLELYQTGEKVAKQTSAKIQQSAALLIQEQKIVKESRRLKTQLVEEIAGQEELGKAYKFNIGTYEQFIQKQRTSAQLIAFTAKKRVEAESSLRVENALQKEFIATLKLGGAETKKAAAAKAQAAAEEKRLADETKKAAAEAKIKTAVDKQVAAAIKKLTTEYDKNKNVLNNLLTKEKQQVETLKKTIATMKAQSAASAAAKMSYQSFMSSMTAGLFAMEMIYRWGRRLFDVFLRLGRAFLQAAKEYSEFIRVARSASFILKTDIPTIIKASSNVTMLGINMKEAAQGLDEFGRAGYTAKDALQAYIPIATFAKAVNTNLGRATTLVTGAMKSFGFGAEDVWRIASGMTNAVYDSRNSFETLETAFSYAGASGAAFGQTFEGVLSAIMAFRDLGLKASTSGTVYRRALSRLGSATKPTRDAFTKLNLDINEFTVSSERSFTQVIRNFVKVRDTMSGLDFNNLMAKTIGPRFAAYMSKLVEATQTGAINMEEMEKKLIANQDTLYNLTLYNMTTLTHQLDTFSAVVEKAKTLFFAKVDPIFTPYIAAFNYFSNAVLDKWATSTDAMGIHTQKAFKEMTKEELKKSFDDFSKKVESSMDTIINKLEELILFVYAYKDAMDFVINTTVMFVATISAIGVAIAAMPSGVVSFGSRLILEWKILTDSFAEYGKLLPAALKLGLLNGWDDMILAIETKVKDLKKSFDESGFLGQNLLTRLAGTTPDNVKKGFDEALKSLNDFKTGSKDAKKEIEDLVKTTEELLEIHNKSLRDSWENSSATKITKQLLDVLGGIGTAVEKYVKSGPISQTMIANLSKFKEVLKDLRGSIKPKALEDAFNAANKRGLPAGKPTTDQDVNAKGGELTAEEKAAIKQKLALQRAMMGDDIFSEDFGTEVKIKLTEVAQLSFDAVKDIKSNFVDGFGFLPKELSDNLTEFAGGGFNEFLGDMKNVANGKIKQVAAGMTDAMQSQFTELGGFLFNDPNEEKRIALAMKDLEDSTDEWFQRVNLKLIKDKADKAKIEKDAWDKELQERDKTQRLANTLVANGVATRLELSKVGNQEMELLLEQHNANLLALETEKADQTAARALLLKEGFVEGWRERIDTLSLSMQEEAVLLNEMVLKHEETALSIRTAWEAVALSWGSNREMMWTAMKDIVSVAQQGMTNLFMSFFDNSKKIKDVLKDLGKSMLSILVSYFVKMLLQRMIFRKLEEKQQLKEGTAQIAKNQALGSSAAWTRGMESPGGPLQALAWSFALTALNSGAHTAALTGLTSASVTGAFNGTGLDGVPGMYTGRDTVPAMVSPGELIFNNKDSNMIREIAATGGTSGGVVYNITVNAVDSQDVSEWFKNGFVKTIKESAEAKRATKGSLRKQG